MASGGVRGTGADGRLQGDVEVRRKLLELAARFPIAAGNALADEAELMMTTAKEQYVPVDLSTLKNSGYVHAPEVKGTQITVEMSFGGAASAYALAVHEHLSQHSPRSWRAAEAAGRPVQFSPSGRGPKYLERAMKDGMNGLEGRLAARLKAEGAV